METDLVKIFYLNLVQKGKTQNVSSLGEEKECAVK